MLMKVLLETHVEKWNLVKIQEVENSPDQCIKNKRLKKDVKGQTGQMFYLVWVKE